jgi:hypothetical protein
MNHDDVTSSAPLNGYEVRSRIEIVVWLHPNGL